MIGPTGHGAGDDILCLRLLLLTQVDLDMWPLLMHFDIVNRMLRLLSTLRCNGGCPLGTF